MILKNLFAKNEHFYDGDNETSPQTECPVLIADFILELDIQKHLTSRPKQAGFFIFKK